ncbi:hypothetical protein SeMB42_g00952 [Synchytrium endobioticum]|nr:hypothetical protein SeMB42_g00952 [Synchytrium endobioticum]
MRDDNAESDVRPPTAHGINQTQSTLISKIVNVISDAVSAMGFNTISNDPTKGMDGNSNAQPNPPLLLLSIPYRSLTDVRFLDDFGSRPWITYRHSFPPIQPSSYTSDIGWGCMLRSGQMMLANALVCHYLGRGWRRSQAIRDKNAISSNTNSSWATYVRILSWFADSNTSPYSIHRIALMGRQFDKEIGQWFGPSTISQVLKVLVQHHKETNLSLHVANDGTMYKSDLASIWNSSKGSADTSTSPTSNTDDTNTSNGVLILIPLRLGVDQLNPVYYSALQECFEIPQCVGIAGGKPNHSLFFLGIEGDQLIFLDPHLMRPTVEVKDLESYTIDDISSYHCSNVRLASITSVDPSLVIGFYCKNEENFQELCTRCQRISHGNTPLFTIEEASPNYEGEMGVVSDEEM